MSTTTDVRFFILGSAKPMYDLRGRIELSFGGVANLLVEHAKADDYSAPVFNGATGPSNMLCSIEGAVCARNWVTSPAQTRLNAIGDIIEEMSAEGADIGMEIVVVHDNGQHCKDSYGAYLGVLDVSVTITRDVLWADPTGGGI